MGILIDIDGVLRHPYNSHAIREGFALYNMLRQTSTVTFLCDDKEKGNYFLRTHKILKYDNIQDTKSLAPGDDVWIRLIKRCRANGPVDFVVTANIDLVAPLLDAGIATLTFCLPSYLDSKFRPDGRTGQKAWTEISEEIIRQQDLLAQDNRL
jgi:hypothetical protein